MLPGPALASITAAIAALANPNCLNPKSANEIAQNFGDIIRSYNNDTANALFAEQFTDYSGSIQSLKNGGCLAPFDLQAPAFSSKSQFQVESAGQPPVPFEVKNVWFTCDTITMRWLSLQDPQPISGISILETEPCSSAKFGHLIKQIFAEFNSVAWLADIGLKMPQCPAQDAAPMMEAPMKPEAFRG